MARIMDAAPARRRRAGILALEDTLHQERLSLESERQALARKPRDLDSISARSRSRTTHRSVVVGWEEWATRYDPSIPTEAHIGASRQAGDEDAIGPLHDDLNGGRPTMHGARIGDHVQVGNMRTQQSRGAKVFGKRTTSSGFRG